MDTRIPVRLSQGDKLLVLRRLDTVQWSSLDDKRECSRCGRVFNGRQIDIVGGTRGLGPLRAICPTEGCASQLRDWIDPAGKKAAASNGAVDGHSVSSADGENSHHPTVIRVRRKRRIGDARSTADPALSEFRQLAAAKKLGDLIRRAVAATS